MIKFFLKKNGDAGFENVDVYLASLLSRTFREQHSGWNHVLDQRLSSRCKDDVAVTNDWKEFVEPEIFKLLGSCHDIVIADLNKLERSIQQKPEEKSFVLEVPLAHREAWLRMLNAARLFLASEHQLSHDEINGRVFPNVLTRIFHTTSSRDAANPDDYKADEKAGRSGCMMHPAQVAHRVQRSSNQDICKSQQMEYEISGLTPRGEVILAMQIFSIMQQWMIEAEEKD